MDRWDALRLELDAPTPWWRTRRALVVASAGIGAVAVALVIAAPSSPPTAPAPAEPPATTSPTTQPPAVERVWPPPTERVLDGWEIGIEGDLVSLGDWSCSGTRTPAVARPATGELFVFDAWAEGPSRRVGEVAPGLTAIRSAGCGRLEARLADGTVEVVEVVE